MPIDQLIFPESPVYKYASLEGMQAILESRAIWATDILHLNDLTEYTHAVDIAQKLIRKELKPNSNTAKQRQLWDKIDETLEHVTQSILGGGSESIFVCSFASNGDQLALWDRYTDRKGVSIGLELSRFHEQIVAQSFQLGEVIYDWVDQHDAMRSYLNGQFRNLLGLPYANDLEFYCGLVARNILEVAPLFKDESFSDEREWRLISKAIPVTDSRIRYRRGQSTDIPHIEFKLAGSGELLRITSLYTGPACDADSIAPCKGIDWYSKNIMIDRILPSQIPIRISPL